MKESLGKEVVSRTISGIDGFAAVGHARTLVNTDVLGVAYSIDTLGRASSNALLGSWLAESFAVAEQAAAGSSEALSLFWVRLYGVLTDIADYVTLMVEDAATRDGLHMFPRAQGRSDASPLPHAIAHLRSLFDEDELIYIEYRRHAECDPFQTRYRARRRTGASAQVPSALLGGRPVLVNDAEAAFRRLLARHEFSEAQLGRALAERSTAALRALALAAA